MRPKEYAEWYSERPFDVRMTLLSPSNYSLMLKNDLANRANVTDMRPDAEECTRYQCRHCKKAFSFHSMTSMAFKRHEENCPKSRTCEHCCQVFKSPLQLLGHQNICDKSAALRCEFCSERFGNAAQRKSHVETCEMNPILWCDWCGLKFPHHFLRVKHQRACPKNPARSCPHCHEHFASRAAALVHAVFCHKNPKSPAEGVTCAACCEEGQCIRFPCRAHHYCSDCLFEQIKVGLADRSRFPLRCCGREVEAGDPVDLAVAQMLSESSKEKYQQAMLLKVSSKVMYCPQIACGALIALDHIASSQASGPHGCPKCQQALCFTCKSEWHAGMTCGHYQFMSAQNKDAITKLCRQMNWMRCFECGHVVEKSAGCNHITCVCGNQFCYVCGKTWGTCACQIISAGHALRHNRAPEVGTQHICQWCRRPYPSEEELEVHIRVCRVRLDREGGEFECPACFSRFLTFDLMRRHRKDKCEAAKYGVFRCGLCKVTFENKAILKTHRRVCTQELTC